MSGARWLAALLALACGGAPWRLGVVPRPDELLIGRPVLGVFPLVDGTYVAIDATDRYACAVTVAPLAVNPGDILRCRWRRA